MDLEARGFVDTLQREKDDQQATLRSPDSSSSLWTYAPDTTELILASGLKDGAVKAMADTMGSSRDTCDSGTNDGNIGPPEGSIRVRRVGRQYLAGEILPNLIREQDWVDERILDLGFGGHGGKHYSKAMSRTKSLK